mmetsp:Transcript_19400/g.63222  ORF Transcript_19400/g.63222 Transcript_19400/m.63222 type:complete len:314 (+) Transcript_19400:284-1225(+)
MEPSLPAQTRTCPRTSSRRSRAASAAPGDPGLKPRKSTSRSPLRETTPSLTRTASPSPDRGSPARTTGFASSASSRGWYQKRCVDSRAAGRRPRSAYDGTSRCAPSGVERQTTSVGAPTPTKAPRRSTTPGIDVAGFCLSSPDSSSPSSSSTSSGRGSPSSSETSASLAKTDDQPERLPCTQRASTVMLGGDRMTTPRHGVEESRLPESIAHPAPCTRTPPQRAPDPSLPSACEIQVDLGITLVARSAAFSVDDKAGAGAHNATSARSPTQRRSRRCVDDWISAHCTSRVASSPKHSAKSDRATKSSSRIFNF